MAVSLQPHRQLTVIVCLIIISKLFFTALPIPTFDAVCVCVRACVCVCVWLVLL